MSEPVRVFQVRTDLLDDLFQTLAIDGGDEFSWPFLELVEQPNPVRPAWAPPPVYVTEPTHMRPDFMHVWGIGWPVVGPTVPDVVREDLRISGEYLPVILDGTTLDLLHVTTVLNVIDEDSSHWTGSRFDALGFHVHRLHEVPLFRVPQNNATGLFCTQGFGEFDFKRQVESLGLTGLMFQEVWNTESGPTVLKR